MPFDQNRHIPSASPRGTTPGSPAPAAPVPPPNPAMPPLSGAERLERMDKGYRPPENYWEEDKPPIKFPFEDRDIPGPPEGMTIPPRQPLPIQQPPPPIRPPWLGPAPDPNGPGWEHAPPMDRNEELRQKFQELIVPPPELEHELYKKLAQGGNQPPPIS